MAEQYSTGSFQSPYKFNGKLQRSENPDTSGELDAISGLYYGVQYYDPRRAKQWVAKNIKNINKYIDLGDGYIGFTHYGYIQKPNNPKKIKEALINGAPSLNAMERSLDFYTTIGGKVGKTYTSPNFGGENHKTFTREPKAKQKNMKELLLAILFILLIFTSFSQTSEVGEMDSSGRQGLHETLNTINLIIDEKITATVDVWESGIFINNLREGIFDCWSEAKKAGTLVAQTVYCHDTQYISLYYLNGKIRTLIKWSTPQGLSSSNPPVIYKQSIDEIISYEKNGRIKRRKIRNKDGSYRSEEYNQ